MSEATVRPLSSTAVKVAPDKVMITGLVVEDPAVIALYIQAQNAGEDLGLLTTQLLALAARASALTGATKEAGALGVAVDQARNEINRTTTEAAKQIQTLVSGVAGPEGAVVTSIDELLDQLTGSVNDVVAGENGPLKEAINKTMGEARAELSRAVSSRLTEHRDEVAKLLDPNDPQSPLKSVSIDLQRLDAAMAEIKTLLDKSKGAEEVADKSTFKGRPYEEFAVAELSEVVVAMGDTCESTGDRQGRSRKSGDAVVEIEGGLAGVVRLVMEAKSGAMTMDEWRKEADKALVNRESQVFLGMAQGDASMPMSGQRIWYDEPHLMVIKHGYDDEIDLLRTVVHLLKAEAISQGADVDDIDLADLRGALSAGLKELDSFEKLQRSLSSALKNVQSAQGEATSINEAIRMRLATAMTALQGEGADDLESGDTASGEELAEPDDDQGPGESPS